MEKEKKHTLRNTIISTLFFLAGTFGGAVLTNLVIINRVDERVRGIEELLDHHELSAFSTISRYDGWLKTLSEKINNLNSRIIKLECVSEEIRKKLIPTY